MTNLSIRLLINHSPPIFSPLFFKPRNFQPFKRFSLFTVSSSLPNKQIKFPPSSAKPLKYRNRGKSSLAEKNKSEEGAKMVETDSTGFNKRRAEGKDKEDKPKNLQLKARKLNPVNTICYVQVCKNLGCLTFWVFIICYWNILFFIIWVFWDCVFNCKN